MHPWVHSNTIYSSQDVETTLMFINRWMDEKDVVHMYNEILSHKKEWMSFAATWTDLEIIILCEVNQKEENKYYMIPLMWNLKYDTHELIYETEMDSQTESSLVVADWARGWIGRLGLADPDYCIKVASLSPVQLLVIPWTVAHQAPPSTGFSRQEYRSGLPFPSPGDLPNPGIKLWSSALQADSLLPEPPGNPNCI